MGGLILDTMNHAQRANFGWRLFGHDEKRDGIGWLLLLERIAKGGK